MSTIYRIIAIFYLSSLSVQSFAVEAVVSGRSSSFAKVDFQRDHLTPEIDSLLEKAYVWAWPMVYLSNVRKSLQLIHRPGVSGGAPVAPINRLSMLTEPASSQFSSVPCPNRDVIYGFGMLDLTKTAIVVQVPDVRDRFWMYQVGDHRTDSFAELGSMYHTEPGFYLLVGPDWKEAIPEGIKRVFRSPTNLAYVLPRFFVGDEPANSLLNTLSQVSIYPVDQYDRTWKQKDWTKRKWYPSLGGNDRSNRKLVNPATFLEDVAKVLADVPPIPSEETLYVEIAGLLDRTRSDAAFASMVQEKIAKLEQLKIEPLFEFRRVGKQLPTLWTTVTNGARFGTDFETRTAVAKSNIFINRANEAKYFYLEQDSSGELFDGNREYHLTFLPDELPPNKAYWSLTVYDADHRLVDHSTQPSSILGNASDLIRHQDGSITFCVQRESPNESSKVNWLPAPQGRFALYLRVYSPSRPVIDGTWIPPFAIENEPWSSSKRLILTSASKAP